MKARLVKIAVVLAIFWPMVASPQSVAAKTPKIVFSISDGVSSEDEANVREGVSFALDYLQDVYNADLSESISVNVRDTADPSDSSTLAFASGDYLVVFTGAPGWDNMAPALRLQVILHEFVHIFQFDAIGSDDDSSPLWFIEGMAEYVSFAMIQDLGILDANDIYEAQTWAVARGRKRLSELSELEGTRQFQNAYGPVYPLAYLAVAELVADDPVERITAFLGRVTDGSSWQEAFEETFEQTPNEFYAQFQTWISDEMLAPSRQPASFEYITTDRADADVTVVNSPDSVESGQQVVLIAQTDPNAGCRFELLDNVGNRADRIESVADGAGIVFWLETIPAAVGDTGGTLSVDCGGRRDRIDLSAA
jgi:hypothetical protein